MGLGKGKGLGKDTGQVDRMTHSRRRAKRGGGSKNRSKIIQKSAKNVVQGRLGDVLGRLGAVLGRLGTVLGRSWGDLGVVLAAYWGVWDVFGRPRTPL